MTLAEALVLLGYSVWWDSSLIPVDAYSDQIAKEIETAKVVIVIWSNEASKSIWVKSEANQAARAGKLINSHVDGFDPVSMPRPFEQVHSVRVNELTAIAAALKAKSVPRGLRQQDTVTEAALTGDDLLSFLKTCSTDELDGLVQIILSAWHGDGLLATSLEKHPLFPEHFEYVADIEHRLRQLGGHMLMNRVRGVGPPYRDIVVELCKRHKIDVVAGETIVALEKKLLFRKFDDVFANLTPAQQEEFRREANEALAKSGSSFRLDGSIVKPAAALAMLTGANLSGFWAYKATTILANAFAKAFVGHGLRLGANAALMRGLGIALGPIGWAATGVATLHQLAGQDRVAIEKGVLQIALLRHSKLYVDGGA